MLHVPRPIVLAECNEEARPCPWVSCRHHLLLEVTNAKIEHRKDPRAMTVRLNAPRVHSSGRLMRRRRAGLSPSAPELEVITWLDEAIELLSRLPYTCTFDVVADYPDGIGAKKLAEILGVTENAIDKELRATRAVFIAGVKRVQADDIANRAGVDTAGELEAEEE